MSHLLLGQAARWPLYPRDQAAPPFSTCARRVVGEPARDRPLGSGHEGPTRRRPFSDLVSEQPAQSTPTSFGSDAGSSCREPLPACATGPDRGSREESRMSLSSRRCQANPSRRDRPPRHGHRGRDPPDRGARVSVARARRLRRLATSSPRSATRTASSSPRPAATPTSASSTSRSTPPAAPRTATSRTSASTSRRA